jgi:hypothetical protein
MPEVGLNVAIKRGVAALQNLIERLSPLLFLSFLKNGEIAPDHAAQPKTQPF